MKNKIIIMTNIFFITLPILSIILTSKIKPITLKQDLFVFEYGKQIPKNPAFYFDANDSVIKQVKLDMSHVKNKVGKYQVTAKYLDEKYTFKIQLQDTLRPKFQIKNLEIKIKRGNKVYAKDLVKDIEDASSTKIYFLDNETLIKWKIYNQTGSFVERIVAVDEQGNQSNSARVKINVHASKVKPTLSGIEDIAIEIESDFNPLQGVKAYDNMGKIITQSIVVKGSVNTQVAGEYILKYSVKDKDGNMIEKIRKVTVEE